MQAQELAGDESLEAEALFPFGLLNVENWIFFRPLPHLGHSMCSEAERTSRS